MIADPNKRVEKGISKAFSNEGTDSRPIADTSPNTSPTAMTAQEPRYEVLPDISVEEIAEDSRTITKVTVRKNHKETIFSKVIYSWGGIFYFRQNTSISESLYYMNTGRR